MKTYTHLLFIMFISFFGKAQSTATNHQVIILGNIADVTAQDDFLQKLELRLNEMNSSFTVLLNGDITDKKVSEGADQLVLVKKIMDLVSTMDFGNLIIIPGDRDWSNSGKGGLKNILSIESAIKSYKKDKGYIK